MDDGWMFARHYKMCTNGVVYLFIASSNGIAEFRIDGFFSHVFDNGYSFRTVIMYIAIVMASRQRWCNRSRCCISVFLFYVGWGVLLLIIVIVLVSSSSSSAYCSLLLRFRIWCLQRHRRPSCVRDLDLPVARKASTDAVGNGNLVQTKSRKIPSTGTASKAIISPNRSTSSSCWEIPSTSSLSNILLDEHFIIIEFLVMAGILLLELASSAKHSYNYYWH